MKTNRFFKFVIGLGLGTQEETSKPNAQVETPAAPTVPSIALTRQNIIALSVFCFFALWIMWSLLDWGYSATISSKNADIAKLESQIATAQKIAALERDKALLGQQVRQGATILDMAICQKEELVGAYVFSAKQAKEVTLKIAEIPATLSPAPKVVPVTVRLVTTAAVDTTGGQ